ncbi:hypothetical protein GDO81_022634 [Engystomops pustulosus]|uniref:Uncharacterized protein n=1 Tax=Engystomops pustulosus TaxID=76066 RepID=A0AAV6ZAR9_ENGPU|nr:hypothetical protein GDO81_022634 [Engystomops pustulosus]
MVQRVKQGYPPSYHHINRNALKTRRLDTVVRSMDAVLRFMSWYALLYLEDFLTSGAGSLLWIVTWDPSCLAGSLPRTYLINLPSTLYSYDSSGSRSP